MNSTGSRFERSGILVILAACMLLIASLLPMAAHAEGAETTPVSSWSFNEATGTSAADSVGGITLTGFGLEESNWVEDIATCSTETRSAIHLNGQDEYLTASTSDTSIESESVTLLGWVKYGELDEHYGYFAGNLVHGEGRYGYGFELDDDDGEATFATSAGTVTVSINFGDYENEWLLFMGTYDHVTGEQTMGIMNSDGPIDFQSEIEGPGAINYTYAGDFTIGARNSGGLDFSDLPEASYDNFYVFDEVIDGSELSEIFEELDCPEPEAEEDNDGVSEEVEDAAPNDGDANNDGTKDSEQPTVASLISPVSNEYVVLEVADSCGAVNSVLSEQETAVETKDDDNFDYPAGLLDFTVTGCVVGSDVEITQYYYGDYDLDNLVVRKYNKSNDTYTTISDATITAVTISGSPAVQVVYTVTDGGELDADGEANGVIVDPVGLGEVVLGAPDTGFAQTSSNLTLMILGTGATLAIIGTYGLKQKN